MPGYVDPLTILFGNEASWYDPWSHKTVQAGSKGMFDRGLYEQFLSQAKNGLDPKIRAMIEGRAAGSLRSGQQDLAEKFASMGNAPIGAQVGAQTNLRSNISKNLQQNLLQGDMQAKQEGIGNILSTLGLGMGGANSLNAHNMQQYQLDMANEFNWGDFLGSLIGAGGQVAGSWLGKP